MWRGKGKTKELQSSDLTVWLLCRLMTAGRLQPSLAPLLLKKSPWGMYSAESFVGSWLPEYRGNGRNAVVSAGVSAGNNTGNGASAAIPSMSGASSATVIWPPGSIPTSFTICSITRYTGTINSRRILTSTTGNWLHGHFNGRRGVAYYESWMTQSSTSVGTLTNWLVMCGKDSSPFPANILVDGAASGIAAPGSAAAGGGALAINTGYSWDISDWALSAVIIWDQLLTDAEMSTASSALLGYLNSGGSFATLTGIQVCTPTSH